MNMKSPTHILALADKLDRAGLKLVATSISTTANLSIWPAELRECAKHISNLAGELSLMREAAQTADEPPAPDLPGPPAPCGPLPLAPVVDQTSYVQPVPDHCDRISYRGMVYGLNAVCNPHK